MMTGTELAGRVALITGAGTGIGRAIAQRFALEGASIVLSGRRREPLEETVELISNSSKGSNKSEIFTADVSDETQVRRLFKHTQEALGPVDILVNNAGVAGEVGNIWELTLAGWNEALRINLTGPWLCTRAAAETMIGRNEGKIINIGSISGKRPLATRTPYTTTKMGLVGLTRTTALELGQYGINVNLISPGPVATPRLNDLAEHWNMPLEDLVEGMESRAALKRISTPDDIAECALFLATKRSRNITGFDINVDGGVWFS